jgi:ubiquinone/menaquinone biosynthesis C-methylase UbiE
MRYAEEQTAKIEAALRSVKIDKDSLVLDVGCGTGLLFDHISGKAKTVVGVDFSRKNLLQAKNRSQEFANVNLILADADYLPFKNEVFSHVFAITVIQNMPKPAKTLDELKHIAKRDAVIVVTGLKKKFSLEEFKDLLCKLDLDVIELKSGDLKCYVAICLKLH